MFKQIGKIPILSVFLLSLTVIAAAYFPFLFVLALFPPLFAGTRYGTFYGVICALTSGILVGLFYFSFYAALIYLIVFLPPVIAGSIMLRKHAPGFDTLVLICGTMAIGIALVLLGIYLLTGLDFPHFAMRELSDTVKNSGGQTLLYTVTYLQLLIDPMTASDTLSAMNIGQLETLFANQVEIIQDYLLLQLPSFLITVSIISVLFSYAMTRKMMKGSGVRLANVPPFRLWRLPPGVGWGLLFLYIAGLITQSFELAQFDSVALAITTLVLNVFSLQGLCAIDFFLYEKKIKYRILFLVFAYLLFGTFVLPLIGVLEHALHLRIRYLKRNMKT